LIKIHALDVLHEHGNTSVESLGEVIRESGRRKPRRDLNGRE